MYVRPGLVLVCRGFKSSARFALFPDTSLSYAPGTVCWVASGELAFVIAIVSFPSCVFMLSSAGGLGWCDRAYMELDFDVVVSS